MCQFAWVGDGVVKQGIHCPESLSCGAHRAPLWTADINLRRQRSGGVRLSSHTTTHISAHRHTDGLSHMHIHYVTEKRERGCSVQSGAASPIIKISFFTDDLHNTFKLSSPLWAQGVIVRCHCNVPTNIHHQAQRGLSSTHSPVSGCQTKTTPHLCPSSRTQGNILWPNNHSR